MIIRAEYQSERISFSKVCCKANHEGRAGVYQLWYLYVCIIGWRILILYLSVYHGKPYFQRRRQCGIKHTASHVTRHPVQYRYCIDVSRGIRCNIDIALNVHIAPSCLLTAATKNANVKSCPHLGKPGLKVSRCNKKAIVFAAQQASLSLGRSCRSPTGLC